MSMLSCAFSAQLSHEATMPMTVMSHAYLYPFPMGQLPPLPLPDQANIVSGLSYSPNGTIENNLVNLEKQSL